MPNMRTVSYEEWVRGTEEGRVVLPAQEVPEEPVWTNNEESLSDYLVEIELRQEMVHPWPRPSTPVEPARHSISSYLDGTAELDDESGTRLEVRDSRGSIIVPALTTDPSEPF